MSPLESALGWVGKATFAVVVAAALVLAWPLIVTVVGGLWYATERAPDDWTAWGITTLVLALGTVGAIWWIDLLGWVA